MIRPFVVKANIYLATTYEVDANTPEEAEMIALAYFEDGEDGSVDSRTIEFDEAYPAEE